MTTLAIDVLSHLVEPGADDAWSADPAPQGAGLAALRELVARLDHDGTPLTEALAAAYAPKRTDAGVPVTTLGGFTADAAAALLVASVPGASQAATAVAAAVLAAAASRDLPLARAAQAVDLGLRVASALATALEAPLAQQGWQPAGVVARLAGVVAVADLFDLPPVQARHAIGLAATESGGLLRDDAQLDLLLARCAADAVQAAWLAEEGFTAAADPLEGRRGLLALMVPHAPRDLLAGLPALLERAAQAAEQTNDRAASVPTPELQGSARALLAG